jgi:nucleotide-binding universal stress UspA family protein
MPEQRQYRNVLVAYDGSDGSRAALDRGAALAAATGASLTIVQATSEDGGPAGAVSGLTRRPGPEDAARARHSLEEAARSLDPSLDPSTWIVGGPAAKAILAVAGDIDADLIVTGSRARGRVARAVLGSVSTELVQHAPCDVLVAHPPAE